MSTTQLSVRLGGGRGLVKKTLACCVMVAGLVAVFYVGTAQAVCKNCPKQGRWLGKTESDEYGAFGSVRFKVRAETKS